jgi:hypothetical protein
MNNTGTVVYNNNLQNYGTVLSYGTVFSELVELLRNIDMNAEGTAKQNEYSMADNSGGRIKL